MTPSNGKIFIVTGPLWVESNGHQCIPLTKASDVEILCFLLSGPEQMVEQTIGTLTVMSHDVFIHVLQSCFAGTGSWLLRYQWSYPEGTLHGLPDSKVHGANMGPTWGRQDPGGHHVGPMNFAIWELLRVGGSPKNRHNATSISIWLLRYQNTCYTFW